MSTVTLRSDRWGILIDPEGVKLFEDGRYRIARWAAYEDASRASNAGRARRSRCKRCGELGPGFGRKDAAHAGCGAEGEESK